MSKTPQAHYISNLRSAFQQQALGLYVGAGVSLANGIPSWDELVLAMYFAAISPQPMRGWHPYPNYLLAIAEWHLKQSREPLDITARKIQRYIKSSNEFLKVLRTTLYAGYVDADGNAIQPFESHALRFANSTLDAVARLCEQSVEGGSGVASVITYNYDELLEAALQGYPCQPFWKRSVVQPGKMPIYHVHGFVPLMGNRGSTTKEIVFTEEQYHLAAHNPYSWANLVQIQSMSRLVGLMIGLSLSDRNMRRLLDAIGQLPHRPENYILLQRPNSEKPSDMELDEIHLKAIEYREKFERSGIKRGGIKGEEWRQQIRGIIGEVERLALDQQTFVLHQLGIRPIWYSEHSEISEFVDRILQPS
jgi:hypothetical protein